MGALSVMSLPTARSYLILGLVVSSYTNGYHMLSAECRGVPRCDNAGQASGGLTNFTTVGDCQEARRAKVSQVWRIGRYGDRSVAPQLALARAGELGGSCGRASGAGITHLGSS